MTHLTSPSPKMIRQARSGARVTQEQAAELVHVGARTWRMWESGDRKMHKAFWELFLLKTKDDKSNG